jgi:ELWxxDGT repeat protein
MLRKFTTLFITLTTLGALGANAQTLRLLSDTTGSNAFTGIDEGYVAFDNSLYFEGETDSLGREPYVAKGMTPMLLQDIFPGDQNSQAGNFVSFQGMVYFNAQDTLSNRELWQTSGTVETTSKVEEINTTINSRNGRKNGTNPIEFFTFHDELYFQGNDSSSTQWYALNNGNPVKQTTFRDNGFASPSGATVGSNGVFFRVNDGNGFEPAFFDGDTFKLIGPVSGNIITTGTSTASLGNLYFFEGDSGSTFGDEPFVTDGTTEGTIMLGDFNPGSDNSDPDNFTALNGKMYFNAEADSSDGQLELLYHSDGTIEGTSRIEIPYIGNSSALIEDTFGDHLILIATSLSNSDTSTILFYNTKDGAITSVISDDTEDISIESTSIYREHLYLVVESSRGNELYVSDGTVEGTMLFTEMYPSITFDFSPTEVIASTEGVYLVGSLENENVALYFLTLPCPDYTPMISVIEDSLFVDSTLTEATYVWKDANGDTIANANSTFFLPDSSGSYTVAYTYFDCTGESATFNYVAPCPDIDVTLTSDEAQLTVAEDTSAATYQWLSEGDVVIEGATSQTLIPQESGNYAVIVQVGACSDTSAYKQFTLVTTSTPGQLTQSAIAYPNPSEGQIMLSIGKQEIKNLDINSVDGKAINFEQRDDQIFIRSKGLFVLTITTNDDQKITQRILVQ